MGEGIFRSKSSILTLARFAGEGTVRAHVPASPISKEHAKDTKFEKRFFNFLISFVIFVPLRGFISLVLCTSLLR